MAYAAWSKGTTAMLLAIREVARHFDVEEEWGLAAPELVEQLPRAERCGRDEGLALGRRDGGDRRHVRARPASRRASIAPPQRCTARDQRARPREALRRAGACFAGVDLDLAAGGFLLVTGPNGSGKTTLLRVLAGLAAPTAGELAAARHVQTVGYLGHEPLVYRELTPLENLTLFARLYRIPERGERVGMLLERFGLWEVRHERVSTFSRGMQQRLGLCRVLLHDPALLVLDEPYNALDAQGAELLDGIARRAADVRSSRRTSPQRVERSRDRAAGVRVSYVADVGALARKDLLLELRAKETLPSMLLFVLAALTIFHFALPRGTSDARGARAPLGGARSSPRCSD